MVRSSLKCRHRFLTTGVAALQYLNTTLGPPHVPALLLRLRLTLAGTRHKRTTLHAYSRGNQQFPEFDRNHIVVTPHTYRDSKTCNFRD